MEIDLVELDVVLGQSYRLLQTAKRAAEAAGVDARPLYDLSDSWRSCGQTVKDKIRERKVAGLPLIME